MKLVLYISIISLFAFHFKIECIYLQSEKETLTESKHCNHENYSNYTTRKMDGVSSIDSEK